MPTDTFTSFSNLINHRLLDTGGVDRVVKLLQELDDSSKGEVFIDGPGAKTFTLKLIQEILSLDGRIAICTDTGNLRTQIETSRKKAVPFQPTLLQEAAHFHRHLAGTQRPQFDQLPLSDLVGLVLAYRHYPGKDLLSKQISFADFEFTSTEYLTLKEQVSVTQRLYQKIERITPAFQALNAGIFKHQTLDDSHEFIDRLLSNFIKKSKELHRSFLGITNRFYQQRRAEYQATFRKLSDAIQRVKDARELAVAKIGTTALESVPNRLVAGVSKRQNQQRKLILNLHSLLDSLKDHHITTAPFSFDWAAKTSELPQSKWPELLDRYETALSEWFDDHRKLIREECLGLSPRTHEVTSSVTEQLVNLETNLNTLVEEINNSGIFQRPFTVQASTTARQQKLVEQLLEQLFELKQLLPAYPAFYRWQHNWFSLPARLRRVIAPMLLLPQENWNTMFSSWYFDQGLHQLPKSTIGTITPQQVVELAGKITSTRALQNKEKESPLAKGQLTFFSSTDAVQPAKYDLVVTVGGTPCPPEIKGPCLQLAPFVGNTKNSHYLGIYSQRHPALPFFQDWSARVLPNWTAGRHTGSWPDTKASLKRLAQTNGCPLEDEWKFLETAYRERGRVGLLIGLKKEGSPQSIPLNEYAGAEFDAILIIYNSDQLATDFLPTATHWWSMLQNTPSIELLHRLAPDEITQALLTDSANPAYGVAAFLRAVESIEDNDLLSFQAIAKESRTRLGWKSPSASPLLKELAPELLKRFPGYELKLHHPWRTVYLPILLTSAQGKRHLVLPGGVLPGKRDPLIELQLQRELSAAGFELHYLFSMDLAENLEDVLDKLILE